MKKPLHIDDDEKLDVESKPVSHTRLMSLAKLLTCTWFSNNFELNNF